MAIQAFLILCGLSVAFLVYVLAQFWSEGRRTRRGTEPVMAFGRPWNPNLIVVTHPFTLNAQGGISVMPPLQPQAPAQANERERNRNRGRVLQMPLRRPAEPRKIALASKTKVR